MQYQSFRGADVAEALSAVKAALGPDAVIERTQHVNNGRPGSLGGSYVEITAAPSGKSSPWPFSGAVSGADAAKRRETRRAVPRTLQMTRRAVTAPSTLGLNTTEIENELATLRSLLEELEANRPPRERALSLLHSCGIEGALARQLANGATRGGRKGPEALRTWLMTRVGERLKLSRVSLNQEARQLITCVGPAGAGKTTTLAKLAARAKLDFGKTVSIVSLDTYRVGAVEQWQRYSALMNAPFHLARSAEELGTVLDRLRADIVLVDTPGRSGGDASQSWLFAGPFAERLAQVRTHQVSVALVVPAWLRARDAENVLKLYDTPAPTDLVITKVDETCQIGGVIHAALPKSLPIAYLCDGPRVPEDIHEASLESVLQAIFSVEG